MKKSLVILLLICLVAPFSGSYIFLHFKNKQIRKEVNNITLKDIVAKHFIVLKFTEEEIKTKLKWKHSREFEYKGHMYDIVDQAREGDFIHYTCYQDHKETRLKLQKEKMLAKALGQDPFHKSQNERIRSFFNNVYYQEANAWNPLCELSSIFHFSFFVFHFSSVKLTPPFPPPKIADTFFTT